MALMLFHPDFLPSVCVPISTPGSWPERKPRRGDRKLSAFQLNKKLFAIVSEFI